MTCECCDKKAEMHVTMPLQIGLFTADMCLDCGLRIHDDKEMITSILRKRAEKRGVKLPVELNKFKQLLSKESKAVKELRQHKEAFSDHETPGKIKEELVKK